MYSFNSIRKERNLRCKGKTSIASSKSHDRMFAMGNRFKAINLFD